MLLTIEFFIKQTYGKLLIVSCLTLIGIRYWKIFLSWFQSLPMFDVFYSTQIKVSIVFVFIFDNFISQSPTVLFFFLSDTDVDLSITKNLVPHIQRWLLYNAFYFVSGKISCISPTLLPCSQKNPLNLQEIKCFILFNKIFFNIMLPI